MTTFTDVGAPVGMPVLATLVAAALALTARRWLPIVLALVAAAGSLLMTVVGKGFVGRATCLGGGRHRGHRLLLTIRRHQPEGAGPVHPTDRETTAR